jgi:hypothetical protein
MSKRKALEPMLMHLKKINTSTDFVYYQSGKPRNIRNVSSTKIGKRPIYQFFIEYHTPYFPLRCMLDLGSNSFVISPEAEEAFPIPVIKRNIHVKTKDVY